MSQKDEQKSSLNKEEDLNSIDNFFKKILYGAITGIILLIIYAWWLNPVT